MIIKNDPFNIEKSAKSKALQFGTKLGDKVTRTTRTEGVKMNSGGTHLEYKKEIKRKGGKILQPKTQTSREYIGVDGKRASVSTSSTSGGGFTQGARQAGVVGGGAAAAGGYGAFLYRDNKKAYADKKVNKMDKSDPFNISKGPGFDLSQKYGFPDKASKKKVLRDYRQSASPVRGPNKGANAKRLGIGTGVGAGVGAGVGGAFGGKPGAASGAVLGGAYGAIGGAVANQLEHQGPAAQRGLQNGNIRAAKKGEKVGAFTGRIKPTKKVQKNLSGHAAFGIE